MKIQLSVDSRNNGMRLDRFLAQELPQFSRSRIQQLVKQGCVQHNGKPPRARDAVRPGDALTVTEPSPVEVFTRPEPIPLQILFEDDDLVVIDKPPGLVVHPAAGHSAGTLVNALLAHCGALSVIGGKERPGIVHRLDRETSGCMVVAKNDSTHQSLSKQFASRTVEKLYLALVAGRVSESSGVIDAAIARHPVDRKRMSVKPAGRSARTTYRVLRSSSRASLVECSLHSGRTHQIRVHLHHLGHPVLGDKLYGGKRAGTYPRQMLHAAKLAFDHPRSGVRMTFHAPTPADFSAALKETLG